MSITLTLASFCYMNYDAMNVRKRYKQKVLDYNLLKISYKHVRMLKLYVNTPKTYVIVIHNKMMVSVLNDRNHDRRQILKVLIKKWKKIVNGPRRMKRRKGSKETGGKLVLCFVSS